MRTALMLFPLFIGLSCLLFAFPRTQSFPTAVPVQVEAAGKQTYADASIVPAPEDPFPERLIVPATNSSSSRGYLTTPGELRIIAAKAERGIEPYESAVSEVLKAAEKDWDYKLEANVDCPTADEPEWIDDQEGIPALYGKALAYRLTGEEAYAEEVKDILEKIMVEVETITLANQQCRLNFSWGTPELVASADLIETYWYGMECEGPASSIYGQTLKTRGSCKELFQNWLVKNPYYVVSYSAERAQSNWGAAATNAAMYIADYLWDREDIQLIARTGKERRSEAEVSLTPGEAYALARQQALDRMNGLRVELDSNQSCDFLSGRQQSSDFPPVKSQITELGIIPEDARRDEYCNIQVYDSDYQNYPQVHLGNNIQQCELMLRRGDSSCYDNVSKTKITNFEFVGPDGKTHTTDLNEGRGSIERAIKAIIVDAGMEWRRTSALEVAYRYYLDEHTLPGFEQWFEQFDRPGRCSQDICFGTLTHGFADGEKPQDPPVVRPPQ